jgi:mRNA degradation ribonuclease J1/J2
MPKWRITTAETIGRDYVVTAETEAKAFEIWSLLYSKVDAEQDFHEPEKVETIQEEECQNTGL